MKTVLLVFGLLQSSLLFAAEPTIKWGTAVEGVVLGTTGIKFGAPVKEEAVVGKPGQTEIVLGAPKLKIVFGKPTVPLPKAISFIRGLATEHGIRLPDDRDIVKFVELIDPKVLLSWVTSKTSSPESYTVYLQNVPYMSNLALTDYLKSFGFTPVNPRFIIPGSGYVATEVMAYPNHLVDILAKFTKGGLNANLPSNVTRAQPDLFDHQNVPPTLMGVRASSVENRPSVVVAEPSLAIPPPDASARVQPQYVRRLRIEFNEEKLRNPTDPKTPASSSISGSIHRVKVTSK